MKTKNVFPDFQINNVPYEEIIYSHEKDPYILLDDIDENRWKLIIIDMIALRISMIGIQHNYNRHGDFDDYYYCDEKNIVRFRKSIMEVEFSKWVEEVQTKASHEIQDSKFLRHFIVPFYDCEVEFIAKDCRLERNN